MFNGRYGKNLLDTGVPFQPSDRYLEEFLGQLSYLSETKLVKELTIEELYKSVRDVIGKEFLKVIKDQMRNINIIESGRHGAKCIGSRPQRISSFLPGL